MILLIIRTAIQQQVLCSASLGKEGDCIWVRRSEGSTKDCRVQRWDNFKAGNADGYLRAHNLSTDSDQADITADGNPNGKRRPFSIFNPFPSYEKKTETIFYLGLFY